MNAERKRKREIHEITEMALSIMHNNKPMYCISLGVSLLTSTIATQLGNEAAQEFADKFNQLLSETLHMPVTVERSQQ